MSYFPCSHGRERVRPWAGRGRRRPVATVCVGSGGPTAATQVPGSGKWPSGRWRTAPCRERRLRSLPATFPLSRPLLRALPRVRASPALGRASAPAPPPSPRHVRSCPRPRPRPGRTPPPARVSALTRPAAAAPGPVGAPARSVRGDGRDQGLGSRGPGSRGRRLRKSSWLGREGGRGGAAGRGVLESAARGSRGAGGGERRKREAGPGN